MNGLHVALIVKATRLCNLRCSYCNDWRTGHSQIMPFGVMAAMTKKVLEDPLHGAIDFIWHGGEPTLLGTGFFEKALHVQARFRKPHQIITNSLQTNAAQLTPQWAKFLRENRFSVSVSLDGPAPIHDAQRRHVSGRGTFDDVCSGIRLLRDNAIPVSALMVVDRQTLALGADFVFDFFLAEGIESYGLLAAKPKNAPNAGRGTPTNHYVTPIEMANFLSRLFDRWVEHGDPAIRIREFYALLRRLSEGRSSTCVLAGGCFGSYFIIEPDGAIAHCDLFSGDDAYTFGNILTNSFSAIRKSGVMNDLRISNRQALDRMHDCPNFEICNGWCPHERYTAVRHDPTFSDSCCGLAGLIDHMQSRIASVPPTSPRHRISIAV